MTAETIDFITKTGWIEESGGRRKFQIGMGAGIREYEKKMLSTGDCRYTVPMHFILDDLTIEAFYDFTGFVQMKEWIKRKMFSSTSARDNQKQIEDVLQLLYGILECIKGMENYLIFPERITVHPDVVFMDLNTGQVALAFYPNETPESPLQTRITELIHEIGELFHSDETEQYLKKIIDFISLKNPGLDGMISFLGSMQRDVRYIYWNTKDFRRIEVQEPVPIHDPIEKRRKIVNLRQKNAAIQVVLAAVLFAVFFWGKLDMLKFAGLAIIIVAIDLMIFRKIIDKRNI